MKISKILLGAAIIIAAPVVKGGCQMMAQNAPQEPIVVDTPFVHDPVMAYENGKYYLYCTGHGITQMTSTDRKHWTITPQGVFKNSEIPAWTHDSVPGFTTHIWAPDVIRFKNKWYLAYSCSTFGKNTSAIGLLSNTFLSDKNGWKDEGCLVASKGDRDNWNAIDPNFIIDDKGNPWLTWGSFWDGIQMIKLDKKTMHVKKGAKPQTIARRHAVGDASAEPNPTSKFAGTNAIEAPFIMKHLINQECFTDTATTIHCHKLSPTTFVVTLQFCYFLFSTYYFTHIIPNWFAANIRLISEIAKENSVYFATKPYFYRS